MTTALNFQRLPSRGIACCYTVTFSRGAVIECPTAEQACAATAAHLQRGTLNAVSDAVASAVCYDPELQP